MCLALAVAEAPAQEPLSSGVALRELGRTTAIGGPVEQCSFGPGDTVVTLGDSGDLVWWNATSLQVLARFEAPQPYVTAMAMHPTLPVLVVASCAGDETTGALHSLDLQKGHWHLVANKYGSQLLFVEEGRRLLMDSGQRKRVAAPVAFTFADGVFTACEPAATDQLPRSSSKRSGTKTTCVVSRTQPSPMSWDCSPRVDSWVESNWARADGVVVAADVQGQLHILGPDPAQVRLLSMHRAAATQLIWSSDSRFVAVQGMGAVRIVDRQARVVTDLSGSKAVAASDAGPEFLVADKAGFVRYHPASGKFVGEPVYWRDGTPDLLSSGPPERGLGRYQTSRSSRLYGSTLLLPLGAGLVFSEDWRAAGFDRSPWLGPDGAVHRWPRTHLSDDRISSYGGVAALRDRRRDRALFGERPSLVGCIGGVEEPHRGNVRVLDAEGREIETLTYAQDVNWLAMTDDGGRFLVGLDGGAIVDLDADSLAERGRSHGATAVPWLAVLDDKHGLAIATGGAQLLRVTLPNGAEALRVLANIDLPEGMAPVDIAALAPDRVHLALASDSDVRVVELVRHRGR
jgi:hypothetical protein